MDECSPLLTAAGVDRDGWPTVAAVFALTVVERACSHAAQTGSWSDAHIGVDGLVGLLREADTLVSVSSHR